MNLKLRIYFIFTLILSLIMMLGAWMMPQNARGDIRAEVDVQLQITGGMTGMSGIIAITVYRIFQEALTNIVRRTEATAVIITLKLDKKLKLLIQDNGKDFLSQKIITCLVSKVCVSV